MTLSVFCILLFAALLHASWNAIVKAGSDKLYAAIAVSGFAALIALILLPFSPQPALASAPTSHSPAPCRWFIPCWSPKPTKSQR